MIPLAPDRLSTMPGLPRDAESFCAIRRPSTSAAPPAGNGTTSLIGLAGYDCANAAMPHNPEVSNALIANAACRKRYPAPLSVLFVFGMSVVGSLQQRQRRLAAARDGRAVHVQGHRDQHVIAVDRDQVHHGLLAELVDRGL